MSQHSLCSMAGLCEGLGPAEHLSLGGEWCSWLADVLTKTLGPLPPQLGLPCLSIWTCAAHRDGSSVAKPEKSQHQGAGHAAVCLHPRWCPPQPWKSFISSSIIEAGHFMKQLMLEERKRCNGWGFSGGREACRLKTSLRLLPSLRETQERGWGKREEANEKSAKCNTRNQKWKRKCGFADFLTQPRHSR